MSSGEPTGRRTADPYLSEFRGEAAERVTTMKWARYLGATFGTSGALEALRYYRDINWISEDVRRTMVNYVRGLPIEEFEGDGPDGFGLSSSLSSLEDTPFEAHAKSLEFVAAIGGESIEHGLASLQLTGEASAVPGTSVRTPAGAPPSSPLFSTPAEDPDGGLGTPGHSPAPDGQSAADWRRADGTPNEASSTASDDGSEDAGADLDGVDRPENGPGADGTGSPEGDAEPSPDSPAASEAEERPGPAADTSPGVESDWSADGESARPSDADVSAAPGAPGAASSETSGDAPVEDTESGDALDGEGSDAGDALDGEGTDAGDALDSGADGSRTAGSATAASGAGDGSGGDGGATGDGAVAVEGESPDESPDAEEDAQCIALTRDGNRCQLPAGGETDYCHQHRPD